MMASGVTRRMVLAVPLLALAAPLGAAEESLRVGGFVLRPPPGWRRVPPGSRFRTAEFFVAGTDATDGPRNGHAVVYHFKPGAGGAIEANLERWRRQFVEAPEVLIEHFVEAGRTLHLFEASGTFLAGRPGGPKRELAGHTFIGAILSGEAGRVFVRFIAPEALARRHRDGVRSMLLGALGKAKP